MNTSDEDRLQRASDSVVTSVSRYILQVRATPSRSEADALAAQLRAIGARNVTVTIAQKNVTAMYRVRNGPFDNIESARATAAGHGHADAWVVRK